MPSLSIFVIKSRVNNSLTHSLTIPVVYLRPKWCYMDWTDGWRWVVGRIILFIVSRRHMKSLPTMGWMAGEESSARQFYSPSPAIVNYVFWIQIISVHINGILSGPSNKEAFFLSCTGSRVIFYCFRLGRRHHWLWMNIIEGEIYIIALSGPKKKVAQRKGKSSQRSESPKLIVVE